VDNWRSYLTHLECTACGLRHEADRPQTVCRTCGKVLYARYDLAAVRKAVQPPDFGPRRWDLWRYCELLPVRQPANVVTLGEGLTPLLPLRRATAEALGLERGALLVKEEGKNPTGTFKARGLSVAVSRAK
jgi:threonine synthase